MAINYHILNAGGHFSPHIGLLEEQLDLAVKGVSSHISLDADVCVTHSPAHTNSLLGIGGGAFTPNLIHIYLDGTREDFETTIRSELLAVLAHESHHCKRIASIPDDDSLIDSLVTEGLACQFELEVVGGQKPSFIPDSLLSNSNRMLEEMQETLEETEYCYDTYFLGKDTSVFPKYAGFAVGFDVAGRFMAGNRISAAESASFPAQDFLPFAKGS